MIGLLLVSFLSFIAGLVILALGIYYRNTRPAKDYRKLFLLGSILLAITLAIIAFFLASFR